MSKKKKKIRIRTIKSLVFLRSLTPPPQLKAVLPRPSGRVGGEMLLLHRNE